MLLFLHQPLNIIDEQHYNKLALSLLERGEFGWTPGQLTAIRPPLYPAFLCVIYKIFGPNSHNAVRIVQIYLSLASGWLVYSLAKKMFREEKVALLACAFFLFYPSLLIFNYLILTETLFVFLFLLALWFLVSGIERSLRGSTSPRDDKLWIYLLLAGVFWGLASLTRSVTYPLVPLVGLFLLFVWPRKRQGLIAAAIFVAAVVLTLSPWMIRNYRVFGHFVAVDTMGGLNLYMGNYEHTPLHRAWAAVSNPPQIAWYRGHEKELRRLNEAEKQRWAIKKALEFMKEHPGLTALRTMIKTANFWQLERTIIAGMQQGYFPGLRNKLLKIWLTISILGAYVFVAIWGFSGLIWRISTWRMVNREQQDHFALWRDFPLTKEKNGPRNDEGKGIANRKAAKQSLATKQSLSLRYMDWLMVLIFFYFTAIHAIVFGHSRYHLPLIPFLNIYAAYLVVHFREIWQRYRGRFRRILVSVCLVFACFWAYDVFIGSQDKIRALLKTFLS